MSSQIKKCAMCYGGPVAAGVSTNRSAELSERAARSGAGEGHICTSYWATVKNAQTEAVAAAAHTICFNIGDSRQGLHQGLISPPGSRQEVAALKRRFWRTMRK